MDPPSAMADTNAPPESLAPQRLQFQAVPNMTAVTHIQHTEMIMVPPAAVPDGGNATLTPDGRFRQPSYGPIQRRADGGNATRSDGGNTDRQTPPTRGILAQATL